MSDNGEQTPGQEPNPGVQFNPQTGFPQQDQPSPPQYPQQGYGYPQQYPPQYGYPQQGYYQAQLPEHPKATAALVWGLVALAGGMTCGLPLVVGPVAWVVSARARREMRAAPQQWDGEGKVTAGLVLGIIATVLLILGLLLVAFIVGIGVIEGWDTFDEDPSGGVDAAPWLG